MNNEMNNNGVNNNLINVNPILPGTNPNPTSPVNNISTGPNNSIPVNNQNIIPVNNQSIIPNNTPEPLNNIVGNPIPVSPLPNPVENETTNPTPMPTPNFEPTPIKVENIIPGTNSTPPLNNTPLISDNNPLPINNNIKDISIINNNNNPLFSNNPIDNQQQSQSNQETNNLDNNQSNNNQNISNNQPLELSDTDKEEYIKAFIGEKYDKIKDLKFSLPAFFLNITYMLYRKMFLYSMLVFILTLVVSTIFPFAIIAIPVAIALLFKPLYMNFVKAKVTKIISNNKDKTKEEIKSICDKKGGTSIGLIFLGGIVETIILLIYFAIIFFVLGATLLAGIMKYLPAELNNAIQNGNITINNTDTDNDININEEDESSFGIDIGTDTIILNEYDITIPEGFTETIMNDENWLSYEYETDSEGIFNTCKVEFYQAKDYNKSSNLIDYIAKYNNIENTISSTNINNIKWDTCIDAEEQKNYNATTKKDKVFLLTYEIEEDADKDKCNSLYQDILKSIKEK